MILLFMLVVVGLWYVNTSSNILTALLGVSTSLFSTKLSVNLAPVLPTGVKPFWMIAIQYLAFGLFAAITLVSLASKTKELFSSKMFTLITIFLGSAFGGIWLLGFRQATDLFSRSFLLVMIGAAPLVGGNLGNITGSLSRIFRSKLRILLGSAFICLLVLNSVFYSYPVYYYNSSIPLQVEDTRHYLEQWQSLGDFVSSYFEPNQHMWGPRLGASIVGLYSNTTYYQFAIRSQSLISVNASLFPYLPRLLRNQFVVISRTMAIAPEYPGYLPDIVTPSRISTRIYDNGQSILLIAFAPDGLVANSNSTTAGH
jgi:hypothetical protein